MTWWRGLGVGARGALGCALVVAVALPAGADPLRRAGSAEEVGVSSARLARLSAAMRAAVDRGEIPGVAIIIGRRGSIAFAETFGFRDREAGLPMRLDSIHRIASMTKPITSLAAMLLVEEGRMSLGDPVPKHLPEFGALKVGVERRDPGGSPQLILEPPQRVMTVHDLLRHTSGLTSEFGNPSLVREQYVAARVTDPDQTNAEMAQKLARLPLQHHPGTVWEYGMSTDVLGRIVEVVSGLDLERFTRERILRPLGMDDTGFWVEPDRHGRMAQPQVDPATGRRPRLPDRSHRRAWLSGGSGMVATAADYARFCQLLLNGGELDGVRLMSRRTVEFMTSDQLPRGIRVNSSPLVPVLDANPERGQSFGLGFAVRVGTGPLPGSIGDFGWIGVWGTQFWVDPQKQLFAVMMMQSADPIRSTYWYAMRQLVYEALAD